MPAFTSRKIYFVNPRFRRRSILENCLEDLRSKSSDAVLLRQEGKARRKAKKEDGGKGWKIYFVENFLHDSCRRKEKHPSPSFGRNRGGNLPAGIEGNLPRRKSSKSKEIFLEGNLPGRKAAGSKAEKRKASFIIGTW